MTKRRHLPETLEPLILMSASGTEPESFSALAFDLDDSGLIGVTGETTAQQKSESSVAGLLVEFDIDGDGINESLEWLDGSGDAFLVDTSKMVGDTINGDALFRTIEGVFTNAYESLAAFDADGNSLIEAAEFSSLKLWADDGDANLEDGELLELADELIFSVGLRLNSATSLIQSWAFLTDESQILTEDVWFASTGEVDDSDENANSAPNAVDDLLTTEAGNAIDISVLTNDSDPDGDAIYLASFAQPENGTVTQSANGTLTYTPNDGFEGVDYFVYVVSDGEGESVATVRVDVLADSNQPDASNGNGNSNGNANGHANNATDAGDGEPPGKSKSKGKSKGKNK